MGIFKMTENGWDYKSVDDLYEEQQEHSKYFQDETDYYANLQQQYYNDINENKMDKDRQKKLLESELKAVLVKNRFGNIDYKTTSSRLLEIGYRKEYYVIKETAKDILYKIMRTIEVCKGDIQAGNSLVKNEAQITILEALKNTITTEYDLEIEEL